MTIGVETGRSSVTTVRGPLTFKRHDWSLFRTLDGLTQMAGVARQDLPRLVLKELVDNALDAAGSCRFDVEGNGFWVEDDGPGFPGTPEGVAAIFSINRPLVSSKLLRLPTRGALGNGLRVVTGAVVATGGRIDVRSGGYAFVVEVGDDGVGRPIALATEEGPARVRVVLGDTLPVSPVDLEWSRRALALAGEGQSYTGRTSAWWYDSVAFHELLQAADGVTVRQLVERFDGCTGAKAGRIALPLGKNRQAPSVSFAEADKLLGAIREESKPVSVARLGFVGRAEHLPASYKRTSGTYTVKAVRGAHDAEIPFIVEAWADPGQAPEPICINRTPTPGTTIQHADKSMNVSGAGLSWAVNAKKIPVRVVLNVTTPHIGKLSSGKAPDLTPIEDEITDAVGVVARRHRSPGRDIDATHKAAIIDALPEAIEASGTGEHRFSKRQLYYRVRPLVAESIGGELNWKNFCAVLTDYEAENGDIPRMFCDVRGSVYHPHTGDVLPLGTLLVEQYNRPPWTFNKVLYIEKEGFFEVLKAARWPERHDCALMTAKGFSTRAARDLIDLLGSSGEPTTFYCVHDADASGSMIYQTLQGATRARAARTVEIVNLGIDPAEAVAMGLTVETIRVKHRATAEYIDERWHSWLQSHRVELESMTSEQFLAWLDRKMTEQQGAKVVPPRDVLMNETRLRAVAAVRSRVREQIEVESRVRERTEERVRAAEARLVLPLGEAVEGRVRVSLGEHPVETWTAPVDEIAHELADDLEPRSEP